MPPPLRSTSVFCDRWSLLLLLASSQHCIVARERFPSRSLQITSDACVKKVRTQVTGASDCFLLVDDLGAASCRCNISNSAPKDYECPVLSEPIERFQRGYMISQLYDHRLCRYTQKDNRECRIEWQQRWRCIYKPKTFGRRTYFQAVRKGILLQPPGILLQPPGTTAGTRFENACVENYFGFTRCSEWGYCEQTVDRLCALVSKVDKHFYDDCSKLATSLRDQLCGAPDCTAHIFETIVCTPKITTSGEFQCHCVNPYKPMLARVDALAKYDCPNIQEDSTLWGDGWRSNITHKLSTGDPETCTYTRATSQNCDINWMGRVERNLFHPEESLFHRAGPYGAITRCTDADYRNFTMLVGKIRHPREYNGLSCDAVYNTSVICEGRWCVLVCMDANYMPDDVSLNEQEKETCETFGSNQAKQLGIATNQSDCWGCINKHDDSACVPLPFDGVRRCKCTLLFDPDVLLQINNPTFFKYTPGWRNAGTAYVRREPSGSKNMFYSGEGKRFVAYKPSTAAPFFITHFEAFDQADREPEITWSEWKCDGKGDNMQRRSGILTVVGGTEGYAKFVKSHYKWQCIGYRCFQERQNFAHCPPSRIKSSKGCYCRLNWWISMPLPYDPTFVCDEKFQGCCNPTGVDAAKFSGYCKIEPGSCNNAPLEQDLDGKDECEPLAMQNNKCIPWWHVKGSHDCPYGWALKGDVTFPKGCGIIDFISVVYGYIPYAVAMAALIEFLIRRGTRSLSFILFVLFIVAMGEIFFKKIPFFKQARPPLSCLHSCGMPSSHSALSVGYFVIMFVDASWHQFNGERSAASAITTGHRKSWTLVPILQSDPELTAKKYMTWVLVGSLIGLCEALIWFALMLQFEKRSKRHFGERRFGIIHDLELTSYPLRSSANTEMALPPSPALTRQASNVSQVSRP